MIDSRSVEVRRILPAPVEEVFRWWTEADLIQQWMSPRGTVEAEVDLRVGGALRIVMKDAGVEIEHRGEFLEIDTPVRLVFTWRSRYTAGVSLVTVTFEPEGDAATSVAIVHSRLPAEAADSHTGGWGLMADRLRSALERTA